MSLTPPQLLITSARWLFSFKANYKEGSFFAKHFVYLPICGPFIYPNKLFILRKSFKCSALAIYLIFSRATFFSGAFKCFRYDSFNKCYLYDFKVTFLKEESRLNVLMLLRERLKRYIGDFF